LRSDEVQYGVDRALCSLTDSQRGRYLQRKAVLTSPPPLHA
jgi:hypothetical protein